MERKSCLIKCLVFASVMAVSSNAFATTHHRSKKTLKTTDGRNFSFKQIEKSASTGNRDSEYALGYMYYYGLGVKQDDKKAGIWIRKAAKAGQPQAIRAMKLMGIGGPGKKGGTTVAKAGTTGTRATKTPTTTAGTTAITKAELQREPVLRIEGQARTQSAFGGLQPTTAERTKAREAARARAKLAARIRARQQARAQARKQAMARAEARRRAPATRTGATPAGQERLSRAPDGHYTVQLMASRDQTHLKQFASRNGLTGKTKTYRTKRDGKDMYVLVYGDYSDSTSARNAKARLPEGVQRQHPWVKSMASVKKQMVG